MCSDLSPFKEDGHSNDTGPSDEVENLLLPLLSQPLCSHTAQYWLVASTHAHSIFAGRILTADSQILKVSGGNHSENAVSQKS